MSGRRVSGFGRYLAVLCVLLVTACGGDEREEPSPAWTPSEASSSGSTRSAGGGALTGSGGMGRNVEDNPPAVPQATLESAGEIELSGGRVQRIYQVRFQNGPRAQSNLVARLVSAGADTTVVEGRVVLGSLAAGVVVTPADTITLLHAEGLVLDPAGLRWELSESRDHDGAAGALLQGPEAASAVAALRSFELRSPALGTAPVGDNVDAFPRARLNAVLQPSATVEQVNAALRRASARIAAMRPGNRTVVLALPDPGDAMALQSLARRLQDSGAFESVTLPPAAPPGMDTQPPPDPEPDFNDHRDT